VFSTPGEHRRGWRAVAYLTTAYSGTCHQRPWMWSMLASTVCKSGINCCGESLDVGDSSSELLERGKRCARGWVMIWPYIAEYHSQMGFLSLESAVHRRRMQRMLCADPEWRPHLHHDNLAARTDVLVRVTCDQKKSAGSLVVEVHKVQGPPFVRVAQGARTRTLLEQRTPTLLGLRFVRPRWGATLLRSLPSPPLVVARILFGLGPTDPVLYQTI